MSSLQLVGLVVIVSAFVAYVWSLQSTMRNQMQGARVPPRHARLRIAAFGVIFIGTAIFVLGTPVSPVYALGPTMLAVLTLAFAFAVRFR
jgi:hypothetical protein